MLDDGVGPVEHEGLSVAAGLQQVQPVVPAGDRAQRVCVQLEQPPPMLRQLRRSPGQQHVSASNPSTSCRLTNWQRRRQLPERHEGRSREPWARRHHQPDPKLHRVLNGIWPCSNSRVDTASLQWLLLKDVCSNRILLLPTERYILARLDKSIGPALAPPGSKIPEK